MRPLTLPLLMPRPARRKLRRNHPKRPGKALRVLVLAPALGQRRPPLKRGVPRGGAPGVPAGIAGGGPGVQGAAEAAAAEAVAVGVAAAAGRDAAEVSATEADASRAPCRGTADESRCLEAESAGTYQKEKEDPSPLLVKGITRRRRKGRRRTRKKRKQPKRRKRMPHQRKRPRRRKRFHLRKRLLLTLRKLHHVLGQSRLPPRISLPR
mmetsp:Transcript_46803/g.87726  ORF Transcript_46803/g.87726 Transcript_46803/m.87726 type:complete len:209 (-) Transcript_46803:693-1319(-)